MKLLILVFSLFIVKLSILSQYKPQNGIRDSKSNITALVNAHIYVSSSLELENASILIQGGRILKIGKKIKIPKKKAI